MPAADICRYLPLHFCSFRTRGLGLGTVRRSGALGSLGTSWEPPELYDVRLQETLWELMGTMGLKDAPRL